MRNAARQPCCWCEEARGCGRRARLRAPPVSYIQDRKTLERAKSPSAPLASAVPFPGPHGSGGRGGAGRGGRRGEGVLLWRPPARPRELVSIPTRASPEPPRVPAGPTPPGSCLLCRVRYDERVSVLVFFFLRSVPVAFSHRADCCCCCFLNKRS